MKTVSIVIPNYNGKHLLETYLPSVKEAVEAYPAASEVVVVDDGSSDDSVAFLNSCFPRVRVVRLKSNQGFGRAVNSGVQEVSNDIVLLLNNDVSVEKGFIEPLTRHFEDMKVFSVVARGVIPDQNMMNESLLRVHYRNGFIERVSPFSENPDAKYDKPCTVPYACAGFAAFDRDKFLELGGFDDLFAPFFWEDVDLSYRAWKRGWWVLYDPGSTVYHQWHGTIANTHKKMFSEMIYLRNRLLFIWKNISDEMILTEHATHLNAFMKTAIRNERTACFEAIKKLPEVWERIQKRNPRPVLSDKNVLTLSANVSYPDEAYDIRQKMEAI